MYDSNEHNNAIRIGNEALDLHQSLGAAADAATNPNIARMFSEARDALDNWLNDELNPLIQILDDMEADTHTKEYAREREQARRSYD